MGEHERGDSRNQQSGQQQSGGDAPGQPQQFQSGGSDQMGGGTGGEAVRDQIQPHMEVIGADGVHVGTVDHVDGDRIKLTKKDSGAGFDNGSHAGHHHYLPLGIVAGIEGDKVRLSANGDVAYGMESEQGG